jgi:hypothetical protein
MTQSSNEVTETQVALRRAGDIIEFDPKKTKEVVSILEAAIRHAENMRDWKAGRKAAELLARWASAHVAWWDANVDKAGGDRQTAKGKALAKIAANGLPAIKAEEETGIKHQTVSIWRKEMRRPGFEHRIFKAGHSKGLPEGAQRRSDLQTGEMEWYTPSDYIDAVREVLGGRIDLDPASSPMAQAIVQAEKFYTIDDDGLAQDWSGSVWLNPPFKSSLVKQFAEKLIAEHVNGDVPAAVMVTNSYTETSWWHSLARAGAAVCFTRGRIKFDSPHGEKAAPTNGQCFYYFGVERERFEQRFSEFGLVMVVWP